jgi:hypothetical protein
MLAWLAFAIAREGKGEHPYTRSAPDNDPAPPVTPRVARD